MITLLLTLLSNSCDNKDSLLILGYKYNLALSASYYPGVKQNREQGLTPNCTDSGFNPSGHIN